MTLRFALLSVFLLPLEVVLAEVSADPDFFGKSILPLMEKYCMECHGADTQKGDVRFDTIDPNVVSGKDVGVWEDSLHRLEIGEMPPKKKASTPQPSDAERKVLTDWISTELRKHLVHKMGVPGRGVMRRLSREEYSNTIRDLLGIHERVGDGLSPDTTYHGFDHVGKVQELSPSQVADYLKAARRAIDLAIPDGPRPITVSYRYTPFTKEKKMEWKVSLHDEPAHKKAWPEMRSQNKPKSERLTLPSKTDEWLPIAKGGKVRVAAAVREGEGVLLPSARLVFKGDWGFVGAAFPYVPKNADDVRLRIKAGGVAVHGGQSKPILSVHLHKKLLGHFEVDAPKDRPEWYEFHVATADLIPLQAKVKDDPRFHKRSETDVMINNGYELPGTKPGHSWTKIPDEIPMPDLYLEAVEIDYNYHPQWPPATQVSIIGNLNKPADPRQRAEAILTRFMSQAYRRPVRPKELEGKMKLFDRAYGLTEDFVKGIKEPLVATLASPPFLFLTEDAEVDESARRKLGAYELASRLSYFFWRTMPDAKLLQAASDGSLLEPEILTSQLTRMLEDPRASAFSRSFMTQWLGLNKLDEQMVEDERWRRSYQLPDAMKGETTAFFAEMVKKDLSLLNLISSDFAMLNERMAHHYKIPGVRGNHYRPVALKPDYKRGGILTQAACMTLTTDAMITNPIYRGVWILEKVLYLPPPPAPANVPPLEDAPKERQTLREQLARHAGDENCASCHKRIDPLGWPFERYSILGEFSTQGWGPNWSTYSNRGKNKGKLHEETPDMHAILPSGTRVNDVAELQQALLKDHRRDVVRSVAKHMMIYALGRPLDISDDPVVDDVIEQVEENGYKTRTLIKAIVTSQPFLEK